MFNPEHEMQETQNAVVDLTKSPVDPESFQAVLTYLATDELSFPHDITLFPETHGAPTAPTPTPASSALCSIGSLESALYCLSVIELADQYQLPRLAQLAECYILHVVLPNRDHFVLRLLERLPAAASSVA